MTHVTDLVVDLLPGGGLAAAQLLLLLLVLWLLLRCLILVTPRVWGVVTARGARVRTMLRSKKEKIRYRKGRLEIGKAVKLTENIGLQSDG